MGFLGALAYDEVEELLEEIKKINKRLDTIEKKFKEQEEKAKKQKQQEQIDKFGDYYRTAIEGTVPDPCKNCPNYPSNGGSGICHCTVPYLSHTTVDGINSNIYNT